MNEQNHSRINDIYKDMPLEEIPWNNEQPPGLLVELVESGKVRPGRALDLGCGLGNYAIWLASKGFEVVGIDASTTAIKIAKQNAKKKKVECGFMVGDLTGDWPDLGGQFDFVYDWGLFHHILPEDRNKYIENVFRVLKPTGKYLSVCFNEKDTAFEGAGKYRQTSMGTVVYLSSEKELRKLFGRFFSIIDFRVLEITGKVMTPASTRQARVGRGGHIFNYCLMQWEGQ
ncbi:MAG: class I SAM-dependent methyltransferase [Phycisphaerae bacterium]|nr:class I SAM-dependent methyltransferase [Phycisphaerae bacterium]